MGHPLGHVPDVAVWGRMAPGSLLGLGGLPPHTPRRTPTCLGGLPLLRVLGMLRVLPLLGRAAHDPPAHRAARVSSLEIRVEIGVG